MFHHNSTCVRVPSQCFPAYSERLTRFFHTITAIWTNFWFFGCHCHNQSSFIISSSNFSMDFGRILFLYIIANSANASIIRENPRTCSTSHQLNADSVFTHIIIIEHTHNAMTMLIFNHLIAFIVLFALVIIESVCLLFPCQEVPCGLSAHSYSLAVQLLV